MRTKCVIWDWNGTLLDDTQAALDTLNAMLTRRGVEPIGMDFYRATFAFPVRPFYVTIGLCRPGDDWDALAREYHEMYAAQKTIRLNRDAVAALERVRACGVRQCVLSALRQDLLERDLARYGLTGFFRHVYGTDNLDGASKTDRARELLRVLSEQGVAPGEIVMIGDALHDREVADALGVACVLTAQGSHAGDRLKRVAPTGETLLDAVSLTGIQD